MARKRSSNLSRRLQHLRRLSGLSCREASLLAGGAITLAASIERNDAANPTIDTAGRFAALYGASLDWLAFGRGEAPSPERVRFAVAAARAGRAA